MEVKCSQGRRRLQQANHDVETVLLELCAEVRGVVYGVLEIFAVRISGIAVQQPC